MLALSLRSISSALQTPVSNILSSLSIRGFAKASKKAKGNLPPLKNVLKKFFLKVHPDRFAQYPEVSKTNSASFQALQSFLQHISKSEDSPPAKVEQLVFYAWATQIAHGHHGHAKGNSSQNDAHKPEPAPKLRRISVNLRTSGGDCRNMVHKTLTEMFKQAEVPNEFTWGDDYWNDGQLLTLDQLKDQMAEEMELAEQEKAGFSSPEAEEAFYRRRAQARAAKDV